MYLGARVVRGPDWESKEQDGGEGSLGTIVSVPDIGSPEKTVSVIWDMGRDLRYRAGRGKFDLRVIDNASTGIKHPNISCGSCKERPIVGMRWKCLQCAEVNLCTKCYMDGKHNTAHAFGRIDTQNSAIIKVPKRDDKSSSTQLKSRGIFPGASVMRGPHWEWKDADGGEGNGGKITEICNWDAHSYRSAAKVKWDSKKEDKNITFRVGAHGCVDLLFTEPADGRTYFKEHLPVVDLDNSGGEKSFKTGDKVEITMSENDFRSIQQSSNAGWNEDMRQCVHQTGTVIQVVAGDIIRVQYPSAKVFTLTKMVLKKTHRFEIGDLVRVMSEKTSVFQLQQGHGGWTQEYEKILGKIGRLIDIDNDGDLNIVVGTKRYLLSPVCCLPAVNIDPKEEIPPMPDEVQDAKDCDPDDVLSHLVSRVVLKKSSMTSKSMSLVKAAEEGDLAQVKNILTRVPQKVNEAEEDVTPLQMACNKGRLEVVQCLIKFNADLEKADADGDRPIHFAVHGNHPSVLKVLLKHKAEINAVNDQGQTAVFIAVVLSHVASLEELLRSVCNVNIKDSIGSHLLHCAVEIEDEVILRRLLKHDSIDVSAANKHGFTPLQWATIKDSRVAVDMIINFHPRCVGITMKTGYTALHIAAANGRTEIAKILIQKGHASLDPRDAEQKTPLHLAVTQGHVDMVELLLNCGSDIKLADKDGNTALHLTQTSKKPGGGADDNWTMIACILVEHGGSLDVTNKAGKTPLQLAESDASKHYLQSIAKIAVSRGRSGTTTGGIHLPLNWSPMTTDNALAMVVLSPHDKTYSQEYHTVVEKFQSGMHNKKTIVEVVRVQNKYLWELYAVKKRQLESKYGKGNGNEVALFHGTKPDIACKICEDNFDFRVAGENVGAMYGRGAYFAADPHLCDSYTEPDSNGIRYMLLAKVLAGNMTFGSQEMHRPPDGHDSVVDNVGKPNIYCVFDFNQYYPEYLIKYK